MTEADRKRALKSLHPAAKKARAFLVRKVLRKIKKGACFRFRRIVIGTTLYEY
jgi:hypothetical protein